MKKRRFALQDACVLLTLGLAPDAVPSSPPAAEKPDILLIIADDMGWSDAGCYGGEIHTPNLDRLAENGLRFTSFYSCGRCWPSRTSLLTGYYPQQTRTDPLEREARLPGFVRLLPELLKSHGYRNYHAGKWHVRPPIPERALQDGKFDRSYTIHDHNSYFNPSGNTLDDQPLPTVTGDGYYETIKTADHALEFLREHDQRTPKQPFFLYLAFTAPHFPLHALEEDIVKYRPVYQTGWDEVRMERYKRVVGKGLIDGELPERMTNFKNYWGWPTKKLKEAVGSGETAANPHWVDLTEDEKTFQAEKMAIYAAMIDRMDQEIGRVLVWLEQTGRLENTLILFMSDNGSSSEQLIRGRGHDPSARIGGPDSYLCLGPGWAFTANTPFRYSKAYVHEGGIASPLIVHWPKGINDKGTLRRTEGHFIDILPTLAALVGGIPDGFYADDSPLLPGRNLLPAFAADVCVERDELFFSHEGNSALRKAGWKAVRPRDGEWELYNMTKDSTEAVNLAQAYPERLHRMIQRWENLTVQFTNEAFAGKQDSAAAIHSTSEKGAQ